MIADVDKSRWLTRRLKELHKSKRQLAFKIGVNPARMNDLENGTWKLQTAHIRKVAEYLEFDRTAFLDFISGDITENELWNSKPPEKLSEEEKEFLKLFRKSRSSYSDNADTDEKAG